MPTELRIIFARAANGVIGKNNKLPWRLPEDLDHFKRTTFGCPVIMGRKTWESLPIAVRPLPGRLNIVVSRQVAFTAEGALVATSIHEAIDRCEGHPVSWVIGGAHLFLEAFPLSSEIVTTEIAANFEGDTFSPVIGAPWIPEATESHRSITGLKYSIVKWRKSK